MPTLVHAVEKPQLAPFAVSDRFRHDIAYFMCVPGAEGVPPLAAGEYWIRLADAQEWLEAGGIAVVSPLDSENRTEVELTEEQEDWLTWMVANQVERVRLS